MSDQARTGRSRGALVGRAEALADLEAALGTGGGLLTIVGAPGVGKTRVALELAGSAARRARFVDVASARTLDALAELVSRALDLALGDAIGPSAVERIATYLRTSALDLVVLDNLEQLDAAAAQAVGAWVSACPGVRFLGTSRQPLGLDGERLFALPPLGLPEPGRSARESDAVRLLLERGREARRDLVLDETSAPIAGRIVARLDGLPLAIELCAARLGVLGLAQLEEQLAASPSASGLSRAVEWSFCLLDAEEQRVLAGCAVFRGGFELIAAEAILTGSLATVLESLVRRSLLTRSSVPGADEIRLGMLGSIRELLEPRCAPDLPRRHAAYHVAEANRRLALPPAERPAALGWLEREAENLRAAHAWAVAHAATDRAVATLALEAVAALEHLLALRSPGLLHERICLTLAAAGDDAPAHLLARALLPRGHMARMLGRMQDSFADFERARALARQAGDRSLEARSEIGLGLGELESKRLARAERSFVKALEIFQELGDARNAGTALGNLGALHLDAGKLAEASAQSREAVRLYRTVNDRRNEVVALATIGLASLLQDRVDPARATLDGALALAREIAQPILEATIELHLAACDVAARDWPAARVRLRAAREGHRRADNFSYEGRALAMLALAAAAEGDLGEASTALAAAARCEVAVDDPVLRGLCEMASCHVDLARSRRSEGADQAAQLEQCRARVGRTVADLRGGVAGASPDDSWELRLALRWLERALDRALDAQAAPAAGEPAGPALELGPDCAWFRLDGGRTVSLGTRRPLRRLLQRLAQEHRRLPDRALSVAELFEAGWPEDGEALPDLKANRVYVAMSALRQLGLRRLLVRRDGGYLLPPQLAVVGGTGGPGEEP